MKKPEEPENPDFLDLYFKKWDKDYIIHKISMIDEDGDRDLEEFKDEYKCINEWEDGEHLPDFDIFSLYKNQICTLADILEKVPKDIDPENILININTNSMMDYIEFEVLSRKRSDKEALQAEYKKAKEEFEIKNAQYKKDIIEYNKWEKERLIKELEEELALLKK